MKKLFLIISVLLCITLSFAGCGNTNQPDSNSKQNSTTSTVVSSTEPSNSTEQSNSNNQSTDPLAIYKKIEFDYLNARKIYPVGAKFSTINVSLRGTMQDDTVALVPATLWTLDSSNFDSTKIGEYTINLKAGTLTDSFKVKVVTKPEPISNVLNVKIDSNYIGEIGAFENNYYNYSNVEDFFTVVNASGITASVVKNIHFAPGTYNAKISVVSTMANTTFIGQDPATTIITNGDCSGMVGGTDASSTITVKAENFKAKNITFENSYDYLNDKTYSDKQAVAALIEADKCVFYNCVFLGYQDTLQAKGGRQYYKDCRIEGCVDYIFGNNATALFENCEIKTRARGSDEYCITAQKGNKGTNGKDVPNYGYVFKNCQLTAETGVGVGKISLGRPWRADATVAWINCEMSEHISKSAYGAEGVKPRYNSMSGGGINNLPQDAHFVEFGNTGLGAINEAVLGVTMLQNANDYTFANIFATTNGLVTYTGEFDAQTALQGLMA